MKIRRLALWCLLLPWGQIQADWDDFELDTDTSRVNEGKLAFLTQPPDKPPHLHQNHISFTAADLDQGWAKLHQCHYHLDAVPELQIVYREGRIRNLQVLSTENIGQAWVEDHSVQLHRVEPGASICIQSESRVLQKLGHGRYQISNGPFMRRFLDGYYPMRVSMRFSYPAHLRPVSVEPTPQTGLNIRCTEGNLHLEALFEGQLRTRLELCDPRQTNCARPICTIEDK